MKNKLKKLFIYLKENQRYIWVFLVLFLTFVINKAFPADVITSEDCIDGNCQTVIEEPSIAQNDSKFYVNDIFSSERHKFYRLIFQVKANAKTDLDVYVTNPLDQDMEVKKVSIEKPNNKFVFETVFETVKDYSDLLFKKSDPNNQAEVFIDQISLSELNIKDESELANLEPTIIGGADLEVKDQEQTKNDFGFNQLTENKVLFGQVFRPEFNFLTGVELDIDVIRQSNNGGKKYALELREVEYESINVPEIQSHPIATVKFSLNDLELYRRENGKYLFPILAKIDKNKDYFIGINNDRVDVDEFNHLIIKGSRDASSYPNGSVAAKYDKNSFLAQGDIYFKTFGFELKKYQGVNIMPGSIIEDRGKGQMFFSYHSPGGQFELINLDSRSEDIYFNSDKKALAGEIDKENPSFIVYRFDTVYPFLNFSLSANQGDITWNKAKISYSFNGNDWTQIPEEEILDPINNPEPQSFNFSQKLSKREKEIYIKIEPEQDKYPAQDKFGIKNFSFQAELITK